MSLHIHWEDQLINSISDLLNGKMPPRGLIFGTQTCRLPKEMQGLKFLRVDLVMWWQWASSLWELIMISPLENSYYWALGEGRGVEVEVRVSWEKEELWRERVWLFRVRRG
jgi:hypothetical protein